MINAKFAICNEFISLSGIISNLVFGHYLNGYSFISLFANLFCLFFAGGCVQTLIEK